MNDSKWPPIVRWAVRQRMQRGPVLVDLREVTEHYHSELCEYDGMEDGEAVCAGECREFAEALIPVAGRGVEWGGKP